MCLSNFTAITFDIAKKYPQKINNNWKTLLFQSNKPIKFNVSIVY